MRGDRSVTTVETKRRDDLDVFTRILHLGLVLAVLLSWATGDMAEDYKKTDGIGFLIHSWMGIGVTLLTGIRIIYGILGPVSIRFRNWVPYTKDRLLLVMEDIAGLLRFRLPHRQPHQRLAAIVETAGLLIFSFLALTGSILYIGIEPGHKTGWVVHFIKESHEAGETLVPLFFIIHAGAVLLHALAGEHLWRRMIFLKDK